MFLDLFKIRRDGCEERGVSAVNATAGRRRLRLANEAVSAFVVDPKWRLRFSPFDPEAAWNTLQGHAFLLAVLGGHFGGGVLKHAD